MELALRFLLFTKRQNGNPGALDCRSGFLKETRTTPVTAGTSPARTVLHYCNVTITSTGFTRSLAFAIDELCSMARSREDLVN